MTITTTGYIKVPKYRKVPTSVYQPTEKYLHQYTYQQKSIYINIPTYRKVPTSIYLPTEKYLHQSTYQPQYTHLHQCTFLQHPTPCPICWMRCGRMTPLFCRHKKRFDDNKKVEGARHLFLLKTKRLTKGGGTYLVQ